MRRTTHRAELVAVILGAWLSLGATAAPAPKNVIVMISDGCGFHCYEAAALYRHGRLGQEVYDTFAARYGMATWSDQTRGSGGVYDPVAAWADPNWIRYPNDKAGAGHGATDSAAAATAMACGIKTYDSAIGVDPAKRPVKNLCEQAQAVGKAAGVITTVPLSHATPAGFAAHNPSRGDYAGIALEMLWASGLDVIMGCGHPEFDNNHRPATKIDAQYVGGDASWAALRRGQVLPPPAGRQARPPWRLVQSQEDFLSLAKSAPAGRVLGLAQCHDTLQQARRTAADRNGDGRVDNSDTRLAKVGEDPRNEGVPTLADMTRGALNVLQQNQRGFFLMIEGGAVDWANHANQPARSIEEQTDFVQAIEAVTAWVAAHGGWAETLVIVTADHETGYLTAPDHNLATPLPTAGAGQMPGMAYNSGGHTNQLVPLFANGAGSELLATYCEPQTDPQRGKYVDNTSIAKLVGRLWPAAGAQP